MNALPSPDLVFRVRCPTPELRYAIRSQAQNLPHGRLWTAGAAVPWLTCPHIDVPKEPGQSGFSHAYKVLRAILEDERLSASVVISDDDMFLMEPLSRMPSYTCGRLRDMKTPRNRERAFRDTIALVGDEHPCHDLHVPTLVDRAALRARLDDARLPRLRKRCLLWRTLAAPPPPYEPLLDTKIRDTKDPLPEGAWWSTSDQVWHLIEPFVRQAFPDPCRWERA